MNVDLVDTTASKINAAMLEARRRAGSPGTSAVLTLVIVASEQDHYDALRAATQAAREHPSRILIVVRRPARAESRRGAARLDAEVRGGGDAGPGEVVLMRLHGELSDHADSVVLPLLLPDAPVVTWWPAGAPVQPSTDALGKLAQRRVTDTAESEHPLEDLRRRAEGYAPGDTDLAWTRLTPWRTLLAATMDTPFGPVTAARVSGEADSPSLELLALWLEDRLGVGCERELNDGPGITGVRLSGGDGEIALTRHDGTMARLSRPGWPDRPVALKRRSQAELIAEEMRRLDPDDVYGATLRHLVGVAGGKASPPVAAPSHRGRSGEGSAAGTGEGTGLATIEGVDPVASYGGLDAMPDGPVADQEADR